VGRLIALYCVGPSKSCPEDAGQIFDLHEVEGYAHREIAELLHCSIGNSKSQLHKAKTKMRDLLFPERRIAQSARMSRICSGPFQQARNRDQNYRANK